MKSLTLDDFRNLAANGVTDICLTQEALDKVSSQLENLYNPSPMLISDPTTMGKVCGLKFHLSQESK